MAESLIFIIPLIKTSYVSLWAKFCHAMYVHGSCKMQWHPLATDALTIMFTYRVYEKYIKLQEAHNQKPV